MRPPIKKECPECGGEGWYYTGVQHPVTGMKESVSCPECYDGQIWNYLTPSEWEAETGEKMLDSDRVWFQLYANNEYTNQSYKFAKNFDLSYESSIRKTGYMIVARPGQPSPPKEWRPNK